jgi:hypothetical protein
MKGNHRKNIGRPPNARLLHVLSFFYMKGDGFVKRPISALRFIPRHCGVPSVRLIPRDSRRLELERFSLPSFDDFLRVHQLMSCSSG